MLPLYVAAIASSLANREKEAQARREAAANIQSKFAASMSSDMPQYGLDAARTNNALDQGAGGNEWIQEYMKRQGK
jgi:hypothetical protein